MSEIYAMRLDPAVRVRAAQLTAYVSVVCFPSGIKSKGVPGDWMVDDGTYRIICKAAAFAAQYLLISEQN